MYNPNEIPLEVLMPQQKYDQSSEKTRFFLFVEAHLLLLHLTVNLAFQYPLRMNWLRHHILTRTDSFYSGQIYYKY